jgi:hypothetical protein
LISKKLAADRKGNSRPGCPLWVDVLLKKLAMEG